MRLLLLPPSRLPPVLLLPASLPLQLFPLLPLRLLPCREGVAVLPGLAAVALVKALLG